VEILTNSPHPPLSLYGEREHKIEPSPESSPSRGERIRNNPSTEFTLSETEVLRIKKT